jgi:ABC-type nitrate/sulfonate/bicarbonate transport system substrate-binding protein
LCSQNQQQEEIAVKISRRSLLKRSAAAGALLLPLPAFGQATRKPMVARMSYFPTFTSLPIMVAMKQGMFARNSIAPELVTINNGAAIQSALVSRSLDFVVNPPQLHLQTVEKGQDVKMFLNNYNKTIFSVMVTKATPTPNEGKGYPALMKDLKGLNIGVTGRGSVQELVWRYLLKGAGMDPERDVSFISVGAGATVIAALQQNLVQAYLTSEPVTSLTTDAGYGRIIMDLWKGNGPESLWKDWCTNCWATRGDVIEKSPEMVKALATALREAHAFMHKLENREAVLAIAEEIAPTAKSVLRKAIPDVLETMGPELTPAIIASANKFLVENDLLKAPIPIEKALYVV